MITYPFHPLVGQSVLVVGDKQHGGTRHLIICKPGEGARFLLPEWMTFPEEGAIRILSCPRLCVNPLVELRALIDRLMASSPGKHVPGGGQSNETSETIPTGSVQDTAAVRAAVAATDDAVELLKVLLAEVMMSAAQVGNDAELTNRQNFIHCPVFTSFRLAFVGF